MVGIIILFDWWNNWTLEILFDLLLITEVHTTTVVSRVSNAGSTNPIQIEL